MRLPLPEQESSKLQKEFNDLLVQLGDESGIHEYQQEILAVWYASPFIKRVCLSQPNFLPALFAADELHKSFKLDDYQQLLAESFKTIDSVEKTQRILRQTRVAAYARIAWRDLNQYASTREILYELSIFAETCVERTLQWCFEWCQSSTRANEFIKELPQNIFIFALGKLGGGELNFSSDIDLVFAFSDSDENSQTKYDQEQYAQATEFYLKVVQLFIKVLSEQTQDGFVFRVDTRLRPFGNSGALLPSFSSIDQYFQTHGRDWERYAWQKARLVAGDSQVGEQFLQEITPFIYRRYLDYGAIQSLREMKSLIDAKANQESEKQNLKTGYGGIREIEFIAQMFQLIYGGKDPSLRLRSTQQALTQLEKQGLLSAEWSRELNDAYIFLRRAENGLQLREDQQIHRLPTDPNAQEHYAYLMGMESWQTFQTEYKKQTNIVNLIYQSLLKTDDDVAVIDDFTNIWLQIDDEKQSLSFLVKYYNSDAKNIYSQLNKFHKSSLVQKLVPVARTRLDKFMPIFLQYLLQNENPSQVCDRFLNILKKIVQRSTYVALLIENKTKLPKLFKLVHASPWISQYLSTHPILLDEILSMQEDYEPPGIEEMHKQLMVSLASTNDGLESYMEILRVFKHSQVIQIAAVDILEGYPIMKVSDHLSWLAETCIRSSVKYAYQELSDKYGTPQCRLDNQFFEPNVLVVEYGKLGGLELSYGSDLDIVFVHNSVGESCETSGVGRDGENKIHNDVFFIRLVQKCIHLLSTFTAGGKVFDTDLRLRPHGESGPIICSIKSYEHYLTEEAWLWEHQALVRARAITDSSYLEDEFERIRKNVLCQSRNLDDVRNSIIEMRNKMLDENVNHSSLKFNIKKDPGGLIDIEFIVQFLVLGYANKHPDICRYTDNIRILSACVDAGVLDADIAEELKDIYLKFRMQLHRLSLKLLPEVVNESDFAKERSAVKNYWASLLHSSAS